MRKRTGETPTLDIWVFSCRTLRLCAEANRTRSGIEEGALRAFRWAVPRRRRFTPVGRAEGWVKARHGDQREPRPEHRERSDRPRSRSERVPSRSGRCRGGAVRNLPPAKSNLIVENSGDRSDSEGVFKSW